MNRIFKKNSLLFVSIRDILELANESPKTHIYKKIYIRVLYYPLHGGVSPLPKGLIVAQFVLNFLIFLSDIFLSFLVSVFNLFLETFLVLLLDFSLESWFLIFK